MIYPLHNSIKNFLIISLIITPWVTKPANQLTPEQEQEIERELQPYKRSGYHPSVIRIVEASLRRDQLQRTKPQRKLTDRPSDAPSLMVEKENIAQQEEEKEREEDPEMRAALAESLTSAARDEEERKIRRYQDVLRRGSVNIIEILNRAQRRLNIAESTDNFPAYRIHAIKEEINRLKRASPETENLAEFIANIEGSIQEEFNVGKLEAQEETDLQNITRSMTDVGGMGYY